MPRTTNWIGLLFQAKVEIKNTPLVAKVKALVSCYKNTVTQFTRYMIHNALQPGEHREEEKFLLIAITVWTQSRTI